MDSNVCQSSLLSRYILTILNLIISAKYTLTLSFLYYSRRINQINLSCQLVILWEFWLFQIKESSQNILCWDFDLMFSLLFPQNKSNIFILPTCYFAGILTFLSNNLRRINSAGILTLCFLYYSRRINQIYLSFPTCYSAEMMTFFI